MCTWEELQKANDAINTMGISHQDKKTGKTITKEYAEVNQRVKAFRMVYPNGYITTTLMSNENGICVFKAEVGCKDENGYHTLATGTAYENETSSFINKTSYIENCETSAVGRALGFAGFGIDTSIASADEVKNAQLNQGDQQKAQPTQKKAQPAQKVTPVQRKTVPKNKPAQKTAPVNPAPRMSSQQIDSLQAYLDENNLKAIDLFDMEIIDMPASWYDRAVEKIKEVID